MPALRSPVLRQRIFEARFDGGYRYLDRCGDAMIILLDLLPGLTKVAWLPGEVAPKGARLICPALDITVVFDTYRLIVDQMPVGNVDCDFAEIASNALSTLKGRFDLRRMLRFGARRIKVIPTESVEEADRLSAKLAAPCPWELPATDSYELSEVSQTYVWETSDRSKGVRVSTSSYNKLGADFRVDERLKGPPHLLPEGQHEALIEQLRRRKLAEKDPESGVALDIDYYWVGPSADARVSEFLDLAGKTADSLEADVVGARRKS